MPRGEFRGEKDQRFYQPDTSRIRQNHGVVIIDGEAIPLIGKPKHTGINRHHINHYFRFLNSLPPTDDFRGFYKTFSLQLFAKFIQFRFCRDIDDKVHVFGSPGSVHCALIH